MNCSCDDDQLEYLSKEIGVLLITLGQDWNNKLFTSWKTTLEGIVWEISTVKHIAPFEDEFSFSGMSSFLKITTPNNDHHGHKFKSINYCCSVPIRMAVALFIFEVRF